MIRHCVHFVFAVIFIVPLSTALAVDDAIRPLKTDSPPVIDGKLDDALWQAVPPITGFKTWHPDFGKAMPEKTDVYCAYDRENLYFGFRCYDSQAHLIKTSVTARDNIYSEDWMCINLDSFADQQSLYAIYVNPTGIQGDSRFTGGQEDRDFDFVWYSGGRIDDDGYTVEVQIPLKSIRYAGTNPVEMAVIFERRISRLSTQGTWPEMSPDQGMNFLTQGRKLQYFDVKHTTLLEILPAVTYSQKSSHTGGALRRDENQVEPSLTAKYGLTSRLILDGTVNPDFSQVEADAGQVDVNLRYDLFFPEKRPFFLEGRDQFAIAGVGHHDPIGVIVHTRKIIDPIVGVKLTGKLDRKTTIASIYAVDDLPDGAGADHAHYPVVRVKRSLARDGFVGGMYTGRETSDSYNRVAGVDGQLRVSNTTLFTFHGFGTQTQSDPSASAESGYAAGVSAVYATRNLDVNLGAQDVSKQFFVATGFTPRTGISRVVASVTPKVYPARGSVMRISPTFTSIQSRDRFYDMAETSNSLRVRFVMPRATSISLFGSYETEIYLGKRFNTSSLSLSGASQITKQFFIHALFRTGRAILYDDDPYQGRGRRASVVLLFQPSDKLRCEGSLTYADFFRSSDSEQIYDYTIVRGKVTYQLNRYLFFRGIAEYNDYRRDLLTDLLASFTYIPGTVIHLGYGSLFEKVRWQGDQYVSTDRFLETRRGLFFKASYLWRL